jgi:hypothetical protein
MAGSDQVTANFLAKLRSAIEKAEEAYAAQATAHAMKNLGADTLDVARQRWLQTAQFSSPSTTMSSAPWPLKTTDERKSWGSLSWILYERLDYSVVHNYPDAVGLHIKLEEFRRFCFPDTAALVDMLITLLRDALGLVAEARKPSGYSGDLPNLYIKEFVSEEWAQTACDVVPLYFFNDKVTNLQRLKASHLADLKTFQMFIENSPAVLADLDKKLEKAEEIRKKRKAAADAIIAAKEEADRQREAEIQAKRRQTRAATTKAKRTKR